MFQISENTNVKVNAAMLESKRMFGQNQKQQHGQCFAKNTLLPQTSMTQISVSPKVNQNDSKTKRGLKSKNSF